MYYLKEKIKMDDILRQYPTDAQEGNIKIRLDIKQKMRESTLLNDDLILLIIKFLPQWKNQSQIIAKYFDKIELRHTNFIFYYSARFIKNNIIVCKVTKYSKGRDIFICGVRPEFLSAICDGSTFKAYRNPLPSNCLIEFHEIISS